MTLSACSGAGSAKPDAGGAGGGASGSGGGGASGSGGGGASGSGNGGVSGSSGGGASGSSGGSGGSAGGAPTVDGGGVGGIDAGADVGDGAADAGSADGAVAYDPCPTNDVCRIMPLGDSITDGCCGENTVSMGASYRLELFHLAVAQHKSITFVGSHASGPNTVDGVAFPKKQEGHAGWTIADGGGRMGLQQQIAGWLAATPPDIVTLMIGTNDVDIQLDLANAPKRLGVLIDSITTAVPKALVVVAQIVPTTNDAENVRVQAFNAAIPAVVKTFADAGKHVTTVDMYGAFTKNASFKTAFLANPLHPTDAGYAAMATTWWNAIGSLPATSH